MRQKMINFYPIGIIHSPFKKPKGTPIQPKAAKGIKGRVLIYKKYEEGLKDLKSFSHIILIYHCHLSCGYSLLVKPYMDDKIHGVFATRAPRRPNSIGISVVKLVKVEKNVLHVENIDIIDGTPLLDIKPYVPGFDAFRDVSIGWLKKAINKLSYKRDDGRFVK